MSRFYIMMLLISGTSSLYAGTILSVLNNDEQVTITNDFAGKKLEVNDKICIFDQNETQLACGIAAEFTPQKIILKLEEKKGALFNGMRIKERRYLKVPIFTKEKTVNQTQQKILRKTIVTRKTEYDNKKVDLSVGMEFGFPLYYYPNIHLQVALGDQFSIGIQPLWIPTYTNNYNIGITAFGGFVTLNWFFAKYAFKGFYIQAAGGGYKLNLDQGFVSESHTPWAAKAMLGWRGTVIPSIGLDAGIAAGGQYVNDISAASGFTIEFRKFLPVFGGFIAKSIF